MMVMVMVMMMMMMRLMMMMMMMMIVRLRVKMMMMMMMGTQPRTTLCASLRSRNACEDFTRATLYRNLPASRATP